MRYRKGFIIKIYGKNVIKDKNKGFKLDLNKVNILNCLFILFVFTL